MKKINEFIEKYGLKINHPFGFENSTNCYAPYENQRGVKSKVYHEFTCWRVDLKYPSPYLHIRNGSSWNFISIIPYTVVGQVIELLNDNQIVIFFLDGNNYYYVLVDIEDIIGISVVDYRDLSHLIDNIGRD